MAEYTTENPFPGNMMMARAHDIQVRYHRKEIEMLGSWSVAEERLKMHEECADHYFCLIPDDMVRYILNDKDEFPNEWEMWQSELILAMYYRFEKDRIMFSADEVDMEVMDELNELKELITHHEYLADCYFERQDFL